HPKRLSLGLHPVSLGKTKEMGWNSSTNVKTTANKTASSSNPPGWQEKREAGASAPASRRLFFGFAFGPAPGLGLGLRLLGLYGRGIRRLVEGVADVPRGRLDGVVAHAGRLLLGRHLAVTAEVAELVALHA